MRQRDDDSAAEVRTRGVTLAIVFPRMPLRQVLAPVRVDGQHFAERPLLDQFARFVERGMIAELESHQNFASAFLGGFLQHIQPIK